MHGEIENAWQPARVLTARTGGGKDLTIDADGSIVIEGEHTVGKVFEIEVETAGARTTALRIDSASAEGLEPTDVRIGLPAILRRSALTESVHVNRGAEIRQRALCGELDGLPDGALIELRVADEAVKGCMATLMSGGRHGDKVIITGRDAGRPG